MDADSLRNRNPLARWLDQAENVGVAYRKLPVREAPRGAIVRFDGDWGVLEKGQWLHRWIGGPILLDPADIVEILPPSSVALRHGRPKGPPP